MAITRSEAGLKSQTHALSGPGSDEAGAEVTRDLSHESLRCPQPAVLVAVSRVRLVVEQPEPVLLVLADRHASLAASLEVEHELAHEIGIVVLGGIRKAQ
jgi:hypothetical protein